MIGKTISHYRITRQLGAGGMGVVYEALDIELDRRVALKFVCADLVQDQAARVRLVSEAKAASALDHPNICVIYEIASTEDGQLFIVMAFYDGESLQDRLAAGPLPSTEIIDIAGQIARGMERAHQAGIVHRDLKPANILMTSDGTLKIVDFGIALTPDNTRLTRPGATVGTPAYMAPEQMTCDEVTPRSDIWSLGVMIYQMMSGRVPFTGDYAAAIAYEVVHGEPAIPELCRADSECDHEQDLQAICLRALDKDPVRRHESMGELIKDLDRLRSGTTDRQNTAPSRASSRRRHGGLLAGLVIVAIVIGWLGWRWYPGVEASTRSIVVLPLENISSDGAEDYLATGVTGEIILELSRFAGMRVISRTSAMTYRDSDKTIPEIAEELDVDLVLEGTMAASDDMIRVAVQLIDASSDELMWAESYDRSREDILRLQAELAMDIAGAIRLEMVPIGGLGGADVRQVDPVVYELYLRGRQKFESSDWEEAAIYYGRAIDQDSTYAAAHAGLASVLLLMGQFSWRSTSEAYPQAREAAQRALDLDPNLPDAHTVKATVAYKQDWNWEQAERDFQRALALDPGGTAPLVEYSIFLLNVLRFDEAIAAARRCVEQDPLNRYNQLLMGYVLFYARQWSRAEAHFRAVLERWPDHDWARRELAWTHANDGRPAEAVALYDELGQSAVPVTWESRPYVQAGRGAEIEQLLREQRSLFSADADIRTALRVSTCHWALGAVDSARVWLKIIDARQGEVDKGDIAYDIAVMHALTQDPDSAFHWLDLACDLRAPKLLSLQVDWELDSLRDRPEYADLVARIGFPPR